MEQFVISPIWHTVTSLGEKISLLDNFVQVGYKWYYFWYMYVEKKKTMTGSGIQAGQQWWRSKLLHHKSSGILFGAGGWLIVKTTRENHRWVCRPLGWPTSLPLIIHNNWFSPPAPVFLLSQQSEDCVCFWICCRGKHLSKLLADSVV